MHILAAGEAGQPLVLMLPVRGATRPRFSSPDTVSSYSKVSWRRCTSNAPAMLMGTSPSS
jgi:hypothetical protein